MTQVPSGTAPKESSDLSRCSCDDLCKKLKCVDPLPQWWLTAPTSCNLVVDPEATVRLKGTLYAQARECQNNFASSVIDIDDPWVIDIHISITNPYPVGVCGLWCVSACLASMCEPKYYRFPHDSTDTEYCCCLVPTDQFKSEYDIRFCIPGGIVEENECGAPYELTVTVTLLSRDQNPKRSGDICDPSTYVPFGVATACELPLMTFYDEDPTPRY